MSVCVGWDCFCDLGGGGVEVLEEGDNQRVDSPNPPISKLLSAEIEPLVLSTCVGGRIRRVYDES